MLFSLCVKFCPHFVKPGFFEATCFYYIDRGGPQPPDASPDLSSAGGSVCAQGRMFPFQTSLRGPVLPSPGCHWALDVRVASLWVHVGHVAGVAALWPLLHAHAASVG